ncbi:hypothetical protein F5X68DRAFT_246886 [Plectosphaerella plurivora]|uniref:Zn(2)-C6 fungal-type domain-containing protein n=1 Tax=Plectosphaerella plurivora TaxID=936078 RepID=A0A9P8V4Z5_9PEZI|nr:hypothetical protein F5X68DRAFT_246886 [Plectosphaerella plurivora]
MVNTGKPSSGCKLCKARRIKCDEVKPFCMKCKKAGRQCPGYTDPFEARIKDQTQATIKRFRKLRGEEAGGNDEPASSKNGKSPAGSSDKDEDSPRSSGRYIPAVTMALSPYGTSSSEDDDDDDDFFGLPPGISIALEDRASSYFASNFILVPDTLDVPRGRWFPFLPKFLGKANVPECLSSAYKSASLVAYGSHRSTRSARSALDAQRHYLRAVRAVNAALQDPERARDDSTLAAVLLLAFYESLTSDSIGAYINHMKGAAMMIQLRGDQGLRSPESVSMFDMTRNTVYAIHCMPSAPDMPEFSYLLRHVACKNSALAEMNFQASQIRHSIDRAFSSVKTKAQYAKRDPGRMAKILEALQLGRALEGRFRAFHDTSPPPGWQPTVADWVTTRTNDELDTCDSFTGPVYGFDEFGHAVVHLTTWTCHLMLTTSLMRCKAWLAYPDDYSQLSAGSADAEEYDEIAATAARRVSDVVSLLPYICSFTGKGTSTSRFPCGDGENESMKGATCQMILWPMFAAAGSDFCSARERRFLRARLRFFAEEVGLKQAKVFLDKSISSPSSDIEKDQGKGEGW